MHYGLRLTQSQYDELRLHLFPGDGKEAVAFLVCGRRHGVQKHIFTVQKVVPVAYGDCSVRAPDQVVWSTDVVDKLIGQCYGNGLGIVKVHCHPGNSIRHFSWIDEQSDSTLFASLITLMDDGLPHASVVMMEDGEMFGRVFQEDQNYCDFSSIVVAGNDIEFWSRHTGGPHSNGSSLRTEQAFGKGTLQFLRGCTIGVVGCSGTGSIVIEQLARLGVGHLVLVDPDRVEEKNLNRIFNTGHDDIGKPKVEVLATAIQRMGLGTQVTPLATTLADRSAVLAVAECDFIFGCMDGVEGRHLLNRLATFYVIPYWDVGVRLEADGQGGIDHISGAVHYIQPGQSSLLTRGVYTMKALKAEELRRTDPDYYQQQVAEGYLRGVNEDRPAVVSVNALYSALCVNDFLARIHPYRNVHNADCAYLSASLMDMVMFNEPESQYERCSMLAGRVGRGDIDPLLDRPDLS